MSGLGTPSGFHLYRRRYDLFTEATRALQIHHEPCKYQFFPRSSISLPYKTKTQPFTDQNSQSLALSPASSLLSEISHQNPAKKRRVSSSSLSDAEDIEEDEDDEDKPLAARVTVGVRSVPGKRSGKQIPGKKSKKSHAAALSGSSSTNNRPKTNGKVSGINGHETKVKVEDKMDENQLSRLTAGVPIERTSADVCVRSSVSSPLLNTIIRSRW